MLFPLPVDLFEPLVIPEFFRKASERDASIPKDVYPPGNLHDFADLLFHDQDGDAAVMADLLDATEGFGNEQWGKAKGRLVKE